MSEKAIILHNIRSSHNVGSAFRTADGAGVSHVYLSGYTPGPIDRFGRDEKTIAKTALGAEKTTPSTHCDTLEGCVKDLKKKGFTVIAVEQSKGAVSLQDFEEPERVAYVFGNEVEGLSKEEVSLCDSVLEIPMKGQKESLNVSVCVGIVLFSQS